LKIIGIVAADLLQAGSSLNSTKTLNGATV